MLLNFQRQFAARVLAGSKRQTIRSAGQRKDVPKVGGTAHCYTGLRTRHTVKLGSWPIERVEVIRFTLTADELVEDVIVGAQRLTANQLHALAVADGFDDWQAMSRWFSRAHEPQDFYGWIIGWAWTMDSNGALERDVEASNCPAEPLKPLPNASKRNAGATAAAQPLSASTAAAPAGPELR